MRKTALLFLSLLAFTGASRGQGIAPGASGPPSPDCYASTTISATGRYLLFNNQGVGCTNWHVDYTTGSSISGISVELDIAPIGTTNATIGAWTAMSGTAFGTTNPSTTLVGAEIAATPIIPPSWVSINIATYTGSGPVNIVLMGYRPGVSTSPGAGFGTIAFVGAASSAPTFVAACDHFAAVNVTAAATTQVITGSATAVIHVCAINVSMSAAGTVAFSEGTGANCGSNTTALTSPITLATGTPFNAGSGFGQIMQTDATTVTSKNFCVAAATGNVVGFISYTLY